MTHLLQLPPEEHVPLVAAAIGAWQLAQPGQPAIQAKCDELGIPFTEALCHTVLNAAYGVHDLLVELKEAGLCLSR